MIVAGFDPGTNCGFALGSPGARPRWGRYQVPDYGGNDGLRLLKAAEHHRNLLSSEGVELCFFELLVVYPNRIEINDLFKQVSDANAIQLACAQLSIPCEYVLIGDWREHFIGCRQRPKHLARMGKSNTEWLKERAQKCAADRGWFCATHDESDACGIWDYACTLVDEEYQWKSQATSRRLKEELVR